MSDGETYWPSTHPLTTSEWPLTLFMCLYQTVEVRNSDESLWLCVYTLESRKEGNQPRSAKSGEVRENSCSPECCSDLPQSQNLLRVISAVKTFNLQKSTVDLCGRKGPKQVVATGDRCAYEREIRHISGNITVRISKIIISAECISSRCYKVLNMLDFCVLLEMTTFNLIAL